MNDLMRMVYGHGGTRLGRILVAAPAAEPADPRWLKILFLAVWIAVPVLVCRFSLPSPTRTDTVIDTSRLTVQPAPVIPVPEPRETPAPPMPKPAETKTAPAPKTPEAPSPEAIARPAITRPSPATEAPDYQPRIARQRVQPGDDNRLPPETRIRRDLPASRTASEPTPITRTRGAAATDLAAAPERRATLRRSAAVAETAGEGATLHQVVRRERPAEYPAAAPRIAAVRERREAGGTGGGEPTGEVGLARGVSLASLEICASPQAEEDAVRTVLGAVGSRRSCRDGTGEYQFTGTRRVSSFNLMIRPAKGRRPTNRCEELENAYSCLTTH